MCLKICRICLNSCEVQSEIANHLRGGRHLGNPSEDAVSGRVHVLDELEIIGESERNRLLAQVRQLTTRDLVVVNTTGRRGKTRLERTVDGADGFPVGLDCGDGVEGQSGVTFGVCEGGNERRCARLTGGSRHRRGRNIDDVNAGIARGDEGR